MLTLCCELDDRRCDKILRRQDRRARLEPEGYRGDREGQERKSEGHRGCPEAESSAAAGPGREQRCWGAGIGCWGELKDFDFTRAEVQESYLV